MTNTTNCPPVSKITHDPEKGSTTVTFGDGNQITISKGFQIDCIDGQWIVVPVITPPPDPSPTPT